MLRLLTLIAAIAGITGFAGPAAAEKWNMASGYPDANYHTQFLLDGTRGFILKRATWHSLDRFPIFPPHGDWVILTDWETTEDLLASADRLGANLTRAVDFDKQYGVTFEFDLGQIS